MKYQHNNSIIFYAHWDRGHSISEQSPFTCFLSDNLFLRWDLFIYFQFIVCTIMFCRFNHSPTACRSVSTWEPMLICNGLLPYVCWYVFMMTSSNGYIFGVTGHLCGEFTGHRWVPHTKACDAELWCFLWNGWVNNREAGDLRRHRAHYNFTVMWWNVCVAVMWLLWVT